MPNLYINVFFTKILCEEVLLFKLYFKNYSYKDIFYELERKIMDQCEKKPP